jgi:hypothetical protein
LAKNSTSLNTETASRTNPSTPSTTPPPIRRLNRHQYHLYDPSSRCRYRFRLHQPYW